MEMDEFVTWVQQLVEEERLDSDVAGQVIEDRYRFDERREEFRAEFDLRVVGILEGELFVADDVGGLLQEVAGRNGVIYFEGVGYNPFGAAFT
jgi:hypothetical protein